MQPNGWNVIERAAAGILPGWAVATRKRRRHMERVAAVMRDWASRMRLDRDECTRWAAAGWLHDVLRDATAAHMWPWLEDRFRTLPDSFWHGPVTAVRLAEEGVTDGDLLDAIRYHTLGHPRLGRLGQALIAADFLEPGRKVRVAWSASMRRRAPEEFSIVVRDVIREKLRKALRRTEPIRPELLAMWNGLAADGRPAGPR